MIAWVAANKIALGVGLILCLHVLRAWRARG